MLHVVWVMDRPSSGEALGVMIQYVSATSRSFLVDKLPMAEGGADSRGSRLAGGSAKVVLRLDVNEASEGQRMVATAATKHPSGMAMALDSWKKTLHIITLIIFGKHRLFKQKARRLI